MASTAQTAVARIVTDLQGITGGSYTYDLSGNDRVIVAAGLPVEGRDLLVVLTPRAIHTEHGYALGNYIRTMPVSLLARVYATTDTPQARLYAGLDLVDDIATALEADRSLNGNVYDLKVSLETFDGDEYNLPGASLVAGTIEVYWDNPSGSGI
jgi:hypothetical protein